MFYEKLLTSSIQRPSGTVSRFALRPCAVHGGHRLQLTAEAHPGGARGQRAAADEVGGQQSGGDIFLVIMIVIVVVILILYSYTYTYSHSYSYTYSYS